MKMTMKLTGAKELHEAIARLQPSKSEMTKVLKEAAKPIRDDARAKAPRLTGGLRKAIIIATKLGRRQRTSFAKTQGDVVVHIGVRSGVPHGHLNEFGGGHNAPQPFLRPAWDASKDGLVSKIGAALWAALARRATKAGVAAPAASSLDTEE